MVGGLILSQALTLFTTPVIYLYLDDASLWFKNRRNRRRAAALPPGGEADPAEQPARPVEGAT